MTGTIRNTIATLTVLAMVAIAQPFAIAQQRVNPDAAVNMDFQKGVEEYIKLRKSVESRVPALKSGAAPQEVENRRRELVFLIRHERRHARQGNILTPPIEAEFRRLAGLATSGRNARRVAKSLKHAEPVQLHVRVNETYPDNLPLQSTPPTLLANFPELPPEVEYRVVGQQLVLLDVKTNLILDFSKTAFLPKPE